MDKLGNRKPACSQPRNGYQTGRNIKSGFTLIEIIVVLIIVGILAAIALPNLFANIAKSRGAEAVASMGPMKAVMEGCGQKYSPPDYTACNLGVSLLGTHGNFYYEEGLHDGTGLLITTAAVGDANGWAVHASPGTADSTTNYVTLIRASTAVGTNITCTGYGSYAGIC